MTSPLLVTGGAGFIGSNFIRFWLENEESPIVNLDSLSYAGNPQNLAGIDERRNVFVHGNITDRGLLAGLFKRYQPFAVVHFAAETHVDRSILNGDSFLETNVGGTLCLLDATKRYLEGTSPDL